MVANLTIRKLFKPSLYKYPSAVSLQHVTAQLQRPMPYMIVCSAAFLAKP